MAGFMGRPRLAAAVALALIAGGAGVPAAAQDGGGKLMDRLFAKMDADGNGALSAAEGEAAAVKIFEKRDANGDGVLSETEFMSHKGEPSQKRVEFKAKRFAAADQNGDGQVSAEEFFAAAQRRFAAADGNGDGQVTKEEMRSKRNQL